jgi:beta-hydroxylase
MKKLGVSRRRCGGTLAVFCALRHEALMTKNDFPTTAYKILTADQWATLQADGVFHGAPVDLTDGYIHMSNADQVQATLDKHFDGASGLVIAEVDLAVLGDTVKWEVARSGALFPHIYGPLPMAAVVGVVAS